MHIWVDADACPAVIKGILYRVAERAKIPLTLVANKLLRTPPSPYIRALQVRHGIDVADSHIVRELAPGDLVVTADIPLASDVLELSGHCSLLSRMSRLNLRRANSLVSRLRGKVPNPPEAVAQPDNLLHAIISVSV